MGQPQPTDIFGIKVGATQGTAGTGTAYSVRWSEMVAAMGADYATVAQGNLAVSALQSETSHADVLVDGDFTSNGIMKRTGAGAYGIVTDNSSNWDAAYSWGNHGSAGYITGYTVTESDVTSRQSALVIAQSQVTGLTSSLSGKAAASHVHSADDIISGVLDIARIPPAVFAAPTVSTGDVADLDAGQQSAIIEGSHVVTTDGRSWVYSGTGTKTLEASYIELGDVTPEWSVIANKPASFTPSTHTHAITDVTGFTNNSGNWDTAYGWGNHSTEGYLTSQTSHADVVVDGDFTSNGILKRTASGVYGIVTDNSGNWNTAYGWGNHASGGYLTNGALYATAAQGALADSASQPGDLATVAFSGDYDDLINTPAGGGGGGIEVIATAVDLTALANRHYAVDTTAARVITLPALPSDGDIVAVSDSWVRINYILRLQNGKT